MGQRARVTEPRLGISSSHRPPATPEAGPQYYSNQPREPHSVWTWGLTFRRRRRVHAGSREDECYARGRQFPWFTVHCRRLIPRQGPRRCRRPSGNHRLRLPHACCGWRRRYFRTPPMLNSFGSKKLSPMETSKLFSPPPGAVAAVSSGFSSSPASPPKAPAMSESTAMIAARGACGGIACREVFQGTYNIGPFPERASLAHALHSPFQYCV